MRYTTRDGITLEVGRVARQALDAVALPAPTPPTRPVETWGGVIEQVPVYDDPGYRAALLEYHLRLGQETMAVLATGIKLTDPAASAAKIAALEFVIGPQAVDAATVLRYCIADDERAQIIETLLYNSTVTQRGIAEAAERFDYKWRDKPLLTWSVPVSHGERGMLGVAWNAARRSGLTWSQFCELSGSEQSAHVAFWLLEDKLSHLLQST
jgi:hypothetical protein